MKTFSMIVPIRGVRLRQMRHSNSRYRLSAKTDRTQHLHHFLYKLYINNLHNASSKLAGVTMMGLTEQQIEKFKNDGMLCIPDFLTQKEVSQMMASAHELLAGLDVDKHPRTQFKTDENDHVGDQYFFDSSDKVSFFFDTDAFDASGDLQYPKEQAINKIGHGLHMHHEIFRRITFKDRVKAIAHDLLYQDPRVLQSMLIFKNAARNQDIDADGGRKNEVPVHTDATFLYTKPQTALGFWFALEDCTPSNGCLSYHPGSHKWSSITKRFVKIDGGAKGCNMIEVDDKSPILKDDPLQYQLMECKAGSLILIHNSVLHKSENNTLGKSRYAYAFHLIDGTSEYDELNWLQVPSSGGSNFLKLYDGYS